ncbi:IclR family transcriptional regulator [Tamaricihabitans halophyticus]|uniref:IclR family transcriptional regulator n=1 Tax=Tamaricihabitans halophyticus TaxID=1262583 RepID=A0A4R2QJV2_9PSEU|nr:IclR family transcriptional regulator [Tamaricihabitans halophyticus]TCP47321.1 IclR family transcriptional regulator [Tamaricihabitans halophyticus]
MSATNSVVNAFRVLECVAKMQPVGLSELSRAAGLPKSSVQRVLLTLHEIGWLRPSGSQPTRWSLTYRAFSVGTQARDHQLFRETALPFLNELQLTTTETIHLAAADGQELVIIERLDTAHRLRAFLPLGSRIPLHASATGLAFLASSSPEFISDYLAGRLAAQTDRTITDPDVLRETIETVRLRGYSVNEEGLTDGITAIGAAIVNARGEPIGSVSVSGPSTRMTPEVFETFGAAVRETVGRIHAAL